MSCEEKVDKIAKILQVDKKLIPVDLINRKNEMNPVIHLSESGPYEFSKDGTIKGKMYTFSVCKILRNDEKGRTLISLTDDDTFNKYPNLVWMVPRCYSILDITDENKNETSRFILQGYRKYGGSRIDEDTGVDTSSINQETTDADRVVLTTKANGKSVVFTMFKYNGEDYIFGGTKTVHRVGKLNDGFEQFDNDTNELCKSVFKSFYDYWNSATEKSKEILKSKLISGYTACGEFEDGKHMIPLPMGENARLAMFGLIENVGSVNNKVDICEEVSEAINFYKSAEFNTVDINILRSLNGKKNIEGYTIHYQKKGADNKYHTFSIEKFKTYRYVIVRMIREWISNNKQKYELSVEKMKDSLFLKNSNYLQMDYDTYKVFF